MKILVTGSRVWANEGIIRRELSKFPAGTIVIHGACPTGADAIADKIAKSLGFTVRAYPADWNTHGRAAGPIRNAKMINEEHTPDEPIDLCLAFPLPDSKGTYDCMKKAEAAKIRVLVPV